jgi:GNAT superfamily N-acetyltransferase
MVHYHTNNFSGHEINQSVHIQIAEINQGFLSSLGEKALGLIFQHVAESRWGIAVFAVDDITQQVVGYVLGTLNSGKLYRDFILKKLPVALFFFLPRMLSIKRMVKALETILYPRQNNSKNLPQAELLDLAVLAEYHGKGVAQGLFRRFETECCKLGVDSFRIPTGELLKRAHRFYEKMGAKKAGAFELHRGELTVVYVYHISQPNAESFVQ